MDLVDHSHDQTHITGTCPQLRSLLDLCRDLGGRFYCSSLSRDHADDPRENYRSRVFIVIQ